MPASGPDSALQRAVPLQHDTFSMTNFRTIGFVLAALLFIAGTACAYEREEYEEDAGASFQVIFNSEDDIYGIGFGAGTWLTGTPVFGDYFIGLFQSGLEDAWYSNIGMTLRIMPHWTVAPFVGGGGSYNHSFENGDNESDISTGSSTLTYNGETIIPSRGDSYWGGHAEAGLRIWLPQPVQLIEVFGRYTWTSLQGEHDYWLVGISTGTGF